ncbi:MAG: urea transporter [Reyranellaceae bacterium]
MTGALARRGAQEGQALLRGYAAVLFCRHELAGLAILAATFVQPATGAAGLVAALAARLGSRRLGFADAEPPAEVCNALLVGLGLGATCAFTVELIAVAALGGLLVALVTPALAGWLWRLNRLPGLSAGFVVVAWLMALVVQGAGVLVPTVPPVHPGLSPSWLGAFFTSLGWFLFTPHPVAGVLLFAVLVATSRYLALLAVGGYAVGVLSLAELGIAVQPELIGFNLMLAAMAVGGTFAFPDRTSFGCGMLAAVLAALLAAAMAGPLGRAGLPTLAAPFLLASWWVLAGLSLRTVAAAPFLLLEQPSLPERSLRESRLARARLAEPGSTPVQAPFFGSWQVSQGIDGAHTHRGLWRDAFDFIVVDDEGRSHGGEGQRLEDYFAFGAPALAPVSGQVWRCEAGLPDNAPGEFDTRPGRNFGNHVLLRTADGAFVLLAHLQHGSLRVKPGDWVEAGQPVGACGNSGRSGQPHLHLHVQVSDAIGAPTRPLHLRSLVVCEPAVGEAEAGDASFVLSARPREGSTVTSAMTDAGLSKAMHLAAGRALGFRDQRGRDRQLRIELTLLGQVRLVGKRGASAALDERPDVVALYDRQGGRDRLLDTWLLALGLTPLAGAARRWADAPPVGLAPLSPLQRVLVAVLRPFGASFDSRYERRRDEGGNGWIQTGRHRLGLAPGLAIEVTTEAEIHPVLGCRALAVTNRRRRRRFELVETGVAGDFGVAERRLAVVRREPAEPLREAA